MLRGLLPAAASAGGAFRLALGGPGFSRRRESLLAAARALLAAASGASRGGESAAGAFRPLVTPDQREGAAGGRALPCALPSGPTHAAACGCIGLTQAVPSASPTQNGAGLRGRIRRRACAWGRASAALSAWGTLRSGKPALRSGGPALRSGRQCRIRVRSRVDGGLQLRRLVGRQPHGRRTRSASHRV